MKTAPASYRQKSLVNKRQFLLPSKRVFIGRIALSNACPQKTFEQKEAVHSESKKSLSFGKTAKLVTQRSPQAMQVLDIARSQGSSTKKKKKKKNGGVGPFLRTSLLSNHFARFATKARSLFFFSLPFYKPASSCNPVRESPLQLSGRPHCLTNRGSTQGRGEENTTKSWDVG